MRLAVAGMIIIKSFVMSINFEEFAEEYCLALEWGELTYIINDGVNLEDLKDLLHSEFPEEQFSEFDLNELNDHIVEYAKSTLDGYKQDAAQELRNTIDNVLGYECSVLEDHELAAIFAEYVTAYLKSDF